MVDVVRSQNGAGEFLQQIVFFVGGAVGADHANRWPAFAVTNRAQPFADVIDRLFPGRRCELAVFSNQRLAQAVFMIHEIESVTAFDTEEVAIDPALVAVVAAHDVHPRIGPAAPERGVAAVATVRGDRADVMHSAGARVVAIRSRSKRADRANINAHAALFAIEVVAFIGCDDRSCAAVLNAESANVHAFRANPHAAVAENAARTVKEHDRRPLLLFLVQLTFHVTRFRRAVFEGHVLQFALTASIAYLAIQRMMAEQQLDHGFAGLLNFVRFCSDNHSVRDGDGASCLQLGHLLNAHQTHAASRLQRQTGVVAERRYLNAHSLAGLNEQSAGRCGYLFAVDCDGYVLNFGHKIW